MKSVSRSREVVQASDMPKQCRTWDSRRRAWVAKVRYEDARSAREAIGKDRTHVAYRCVGQGHWHVGAA